MGNLSIEQVSERKRKYYIWAKSDEQLLEISMMYTFKMRLNIRKLHFSPKSIEIRIIIQLLKREVKPVTLFLFSIWFLIWSDEMRRNCGIYQKETSKIILLKEVDKNFEREVFSNKESLFEGAIPPDWTWNSRPQPSGNIWGKIL